MFCAFGYINFGEKNSWEKHSAGGSRYKKKEAFRYGLNYSKMRSKTAIQARPLPYT